MGLEKGIKFGKEHRKPYRGSKRYFMSCRNHGSCAWCQSNRHFKFRDKHPADVDIRKTEEVEEKIDD